MPLSLSILMFSIILFLVTPPLLIFVVFESLLVETDSDILTFVNLLLMLL